MRGRVVGWLVVVGGWAELNEWCARANRKCSLAYQRAEKKSHVTEKNALAHFTTPQKEQPALSVKRSERPPIR